MKKKIIFVLSLCCLLIAGLAESDALASTVLPEAVTSESSDWESEEEPFQTKLSLNLLLYKGDTTFVGIRYCEGDVHTLVSSNSSVVKVDKKGKMKALKCGRANVTAILENDGRRQELVLRVRVKASSYKKTSPHGKGAEAVKRASQTGFTAYRELAPGETFQINAKWVSGNAKLTYISTDASVAKVSGKGIVTTRKKGSCTIRAILQDGKEKAVYRLKLFVKEPQKLTVTNKQKDDFFNDSVMVGNSLGVGLDLYCRRQYEGFLGNEKHFSSNSYSLMNDKRPISASSLHPTYKGKKYRVKDALKVMKAKKVFLSFGMNDLNIYGVEGSAKEYRQFIRQLQKVNKGLEVYIVSQTPVRRTSGKLENGCIRKFNGLMEQYAKKTKNVYYVNIFDSFLDRTDRLASAYCSDGFCHLTNAGYEVWTNRLKSFAGAQIAKEISAKDAMTTVKESHLREDYRLAKKKVEKLDTGALRTNYLKQLKGLKEKLKS